MNFAASKADEQKALTHPWGLRDAANIIRIVAREIVAREIDGRT